MLVNKTLSYVINIENKPIIKQALGAITSDGWFRSVYIIETQGKLHLIKFTTLGKICYLAARVIGQGSAFIQCGSNLQGKVVSIAEVTKTLQAALLKRDLVGNIITINSHGSYSKDDFTLPPHTYVLAPHVKGFDKPYVVNFPHNKAFEEMIYEEGKETIPMPIKGGWRVYKPGERIKNLQLSPWGSKEFDRWKASLPPVAQQDAITIEALGSIPPFSKIPARKASGQQYVYKGKAKHKVKIFASTCLKDIVEKLKVDATKEEPMIIIPLACNARQGSGEDTINFDVSKQGIRKNLTTLVGVK